MAMLLLLRLLSAPLLQRARNQGKPFFMTVAPTACHDWMNWKDTDFGGTGKLLGPPKSPKRHRNLYKDVKLPRVGAVQHVATAS